MTDNYPPRIGTGLDGPPRIAPLRADEMTPRGWEVMNNARDLTGYPRNAPLHPFLATFCRHTEMFDKYMEFGMNFLLASNIPARERELLILRTGWLCDAPYEWGEHVAAGLNHGLTADEIERVKIGPEAEGWRALDRAILQAVDELHETSTISDATWAALAEHFDDCQLLELPVMVGQYHTTAFLQNALRFAPGRDKHGQTIEDKSIEQEPAE